MATILVSYHPVNMLKSIFGLIQSVGEFCNLLRTHSYVFYLAFQGCCITVFFGSAQQNFFILRQGFPAPGGCVQSDLMLNAVMGLCFHVVLSDLSNLRPRGRFLWCSAELRYFVWSSRVNARRGMETSEYSRAIVLLVGEVPRSQVYGRGIF